VYRKHSRKKQVIPLGKTRIFTHIKIVILPRKSTEKRRLSTAVEKLQQYLEINQVEDLKIAVLKCWKEQKKKLIDIGFREWFSKDLEINFRTVSRTLDVWGANPRQSTWNKYIFTAPGVQERYCVVSCRRYLLSAWYCFSYTM